MPGEAELYIVSREEVLMQNHEGLYLWPITHKMYYASSLRAVFFFIWLVASELPQDYPTNSIM
jgi:hypothetical protein